MNKGLIITLSFFVLVLNLKAQTNFKYTYDNAGNRIKREVVVLEMEKKEAVAEDSIASAIAGNNLVPIDSTQENANSPLKTNLDQAIQLTVFPNPTQGELKFTITGMEELKTIQATVVNMSGNIVKNQTLHSITETIDLSPFANGTYLLRLVFDGKISKEIIVIKK